MKTWGWLLLALVTAGCAPAPSGEMFLMRVEAVIDAPPATVYARTADPIREAELRREAPRFEADGPLRLGTTYLETIDLGLVNDYRMKVQVTALEPGRRVRLEAPPDWHRSFAVERLYLPEGGATRLVYIVEYEDRVLRDIVVLPLPRWFAQTVYRSDMRAYLRRLAAEFAP